MENNLQLNSDRFLGFANIYDNARPKSPEKVKEILLGYLGKGPSVVVDLGCGTGLSTIIWNDISNKVIGVEPSNDMIKLAREKALSQGGLQSILKANIDEINPFLSSFKENIIDIFGESELKIEFCYRMRIGIK